MTSENPSWTAWAVQQVASVRLGVCRGNSDLAGYTIVTVLWQSYLTS